MNWVLQAGGRQLAAFLSKPRHIHMATPPTPRDILLASLRPADVLLVEGHSMISSAIRYLTNSTWSHAALYVGPDAGGLSGPDHMFVEADINAGVRSVGLEEFTGLATRICRPVGLMEKQRRAVCDYAVGRIGSRYDLKNVIDLARYLLPTPPVPQRFRRSMIALGSGDPTRAICSTLIAQAFESVSYPILPIYETRPTEDASCPGCTEEVLRIRHHSLYAPRDFDVSPYFAVIKPTIESGFQHDALKWA